METTTATLEAEIRFWEAELATAPRSELRQREAALNTLRRIAEMEEDEIRPDLW